MRTQLKTIEQNPEGYYATAEEYEALMPEKKMLLWMLERALRDALGVSQRGQPEISQYERGQAIFWFLDESQRPFGYLWTCEHLELSAHFRKLVRTMIREADRYGPLISMRLSAGQGILI